MTPQAITSLAGAGLGLIGGIGSIFSTRRANKDLNKLISQNPTYNINPIAKSRLALAEMLLNSRMPGATGVERNIYANQANQMANINRNATDSSQALALASSAQGQTNQAFQNLGINEAQDYQRRLQNVFGAQEGMIAEGDKVYQDQVRRFMDLAQIRGAQAANRQAIWGTIGKMGQAGMNFGMAGGFNGMFPQQAAGAAAGGMGDAGLSAIGMIPGI